MNTRKIALTAAVSLLGMAVLAPFAQFGVLQTLIVPADAEATARNIAASAGLFGTAIIAFFAVAILDVVVGWAAYALFRPIDARRARLVGLARVAYAAGFAYALTHLVRAAGLSDPTQVASAIAGFQTTWDLALLIFGLHLVGLGMLVARSVDFPRLLGALVVVAGVGYLVDALGRLFVPGYSLTVSQITFIGEALLIVWLFKLAIRGSRRSEAGPAQGTPATRPSLDQPTAADSGILSPFRSSEAGTRWLMSRNSRRGGAMRTTETGRSPVPAILVSIVVGAVLAVVLLLVAAPDGSEPLVTGSVLLAFGLGWALMAYLTSRFSGQPQRWMYIPAVSLAGVGLVLAVIQPGPSLMDFLGLVWPIALAVLAVWMLVQLRRELRGAGRWLVGALVVTLVLIAVAGGVTTVGAAATAPQAAGTGQLTDVGGRRLYLRCEGTGSPVVILQAGLGGSSGSWARIQPALAAKTTVCSYDRAGHDRSDDAPVLQDGNAIAKDLHDLLAKAGIAGPYVLVGHSSGGPYVRVFTANYPGDVVGMVLLDPQPADAFTSLPDYPSIYNTLRLTGGIAPSLARIGLLGPIFGVSASEATAAIARSQRDEFRALPAALEQAAAVTSIGDRPLIIVTAATDAQRGWLAAHDQMITLSTNAVHRVLERATHDSVLEGDDAGASVEAILDVVAAIRDGKPLR